MTALPLALAALTKSTALVAIAASGSALRDTRARRRAARADRRGARSSRSRRPCSRRTRCACCEAGGGSMLAGGVGRRGLARRARGDGRAAARRAPTRRLRFVPASTWTEPVYSAPGLVRSVPGLLWASTWADGHAQFLPASDAARRARRRRSRRWRASFPTLLAIFGIVRVARDRRALRRGGRSVLCSSRCSSRRWLRYTLGDPRVLRGEGELSAVRDVPGGAAAGDRDGRPRSPARARSRAARCSRSRSA